MGSVGLFFCGLVLSGIGPTGRRQRPGGRWWRCGPGGRLVPVGTVSHRPFSGLPGEVGMARETRALPGGGSGPDGPLAEIRASRPAGLVGTVSHRPFPGPPGEVGTARETRALPGVAAAWGPLVGIRAGRPAGSGRDGVSPSVPWVVRSLGCRARWEWPERLGPYREVAAAWSRWRRFGPEGPRVLVGTVSHRPFPGLSVPWAAGRGGEGPWDTGPTGRWQRPGGRWWRFGPGCPLVPVGTVQRQLFFPFGDN